jgi:hypothetical protein
MPGCFKVTAEPYLNLRKGPSVQHAVTGHANQGELLWMETNDQLVAITSGFVKVTNLGLHPVYDPSYTGYASEEYLQYIHPYKDQCKR